MEHTTKALATHGVGTAECVEKSQTKASVRSMRNSSSYRCSEAEPVVERHQQPRVCETHGIYDRQYEAVSVPQIPLVKIDSVKP